MALGLSSLIWDESHGRLCEDMRLPISHLQFDAFARYLLVTSVLNLLWETLQLPLYTIWSTGSLSEIAFAVVHCTVGDVMIAGIALTAALAICQTNTWPVKGVSRVDMATILFGVCYTVFSEWRNTTVTMSWTYAPSMPQLSRIGLAPVVQWLLVPALALWAVHKQFADS
mgnify:CR=1 FL=1